MEYFEKCLNYDPLPMCCCGIPGEKRRNLPTVSDTFGTSPLLNVWTDRDRSQPSFLAQAAPS